MLHEGWKRVVKLSVLAVLFKEAEIEGLKTFKCVFVQNQAHLVKGYFILKILHVTPTPNKNHIVQLQSTLQSAVDAIDLEPCCQTNIYA